MGAGARLTQCTNFSLRLAKRVQSNVMLDIIIFIHKSERTLCDPKGVGGLILPGPICPRIGLGKAPGQGPLRFVRIFSLWAGNRVSGPDLGWIRVSKAFGRPVGQLLCLPV